MLSSLCVCVCVCVSVCVHEILLTGFEGWVDYCLTILVHLCFMENVTSL